MTDDQSNPAASRLHVRGTYRLQFNSGFTLTHALDLVPYLARLGISHVYASPLLTALRGSAHGYDGCDPSRINPEIGTEEQLDEFVFALRQHGMGLVLDIVPNHMGIKGPENAWWWDVLKRGQNSRYAHFFDVDWDSPSPCLKGKVLLPILADEYQNVLARQELQVKSGGSEVILRYFKHLFPIDPESIPIRPRSEDDVLTQLNTNRRLLDELLQRQHYRLADWRCGDTELNYRRFFTITTLAGLRVEDPQVFAAVHERIIDWCDRGWIDGLRVDHPDGLRDPEQYLHRLRQAAPSAWIAVEKILADREELPRSWPVAGTTGYDFLNQALQLFVDRAGEKPLTELYAGFTGQANEYESLLLEKKRWVLRHQLVAEVKFLVRLAQAAADGMGKRLVFADELLEAGITELIAYFPLYRTYIRAPQGQATEADVQAINVAATKAGRCRPDLLESVFPFLVDSLVLRPQAPAAAEFVMRFQQLTGPVMAKGAEDTAFYCFNRLIALNEVGGNPANCGTDVEEFHGWCMRTEGQWPQTMLATSTHDTKRSEDVRARLALLSELAPSWSAAVERWSTINESHRRKDWPDRNLEYLFYQTLVGAWPLPAERAKAFMQKAAREAKVHTNWTDPNAEYEDALSQFVTATLSDDRFIEEVNQFVAPLILPGYCNSMAQTLLKVTVPGLPDIYQGTEFWDFSLVDPDNRRPVDFTRRKEALDRLQQRLAKEGPLRLASELLKSPHDGSLKQFLIYQALRFRHEQEPLFRLGKYVPLLTKGGHAAHICAFARIVDQTIAITAVPRLIVPLFALGEPWPLGESVWENTLVVLPKAQAGREYRSVFTDRRLVVQADGPNCALRIAEVLFDFPVALLELAPAR